MDEEEEVSMSDLERREALKADLRSYFDYCDADLASEVAINLCMDALDVIEAADVLAMQVRNQQNYIYRLATTGEKSND